MPLSLISINSLYRLHGFPLALGLLGMGEAHVAKRDLSACFGGYSPSRLHWLWQEYDSHASTRPGESIPSLGSHADQCQRLPPPSLINGILSLKYMAE